MKRNILVTGGAGFIGSFIVDGLLEKGHNVRVLDSLDRQVHEGGRKPAYLSQKAEFLKGDIRNRADVVKAIEGVDVIFHEAAAVGVGQSMYEIERYVDTNMRGTATLLDVLANEEHNVKKVLIAASMSSYGEGGYSCAKCGQVAPELRTAEGCRKGWEPRCPECGGILEPLPTPETKLQNPNSVYALTKMGQEKMALMVGKAYGIKVSALRYFNVFGPRQSLNNPYSGVAATFLSRLKNNKSPVVYEDGMQTRDFVYVGDVVQANLLAMESNAANYESFNVGTGKPRTIRGIAETLAELLGKGIKPEITNRFRKGDVRHCFADITKIRKKLGFEPGVSFDAGMKELISWGSGVEARDRFDAAAEELERKGLV